MAGAVKIKHAVILAAGRGQRMMPLTGELPKAMAPYRGTTLIAQGIERVGAHVENVHITVGHRAAMLAEHVIHHGARSVIGTEGQSNSWWIHNTLLAELDEPVYVLTCDNVIELDFDRIAAEYARLGSPPCMLVPVKPVPGLDGDYIFEVEQRVTDLSRTQTAPTYCSGVQVLHPRRVREMTDGGGDFDDVWRQLIAAGALYCSRVYPDRWISLDTMEQLADADPEQAAALRERFGEAGAGALGG